MNKNKIVIDNKDGKFGVQEYCARCGCDMGIHNYTNKEKADNSISGILKIYCQSCGEYYKNMIIKRTKRNRFKQIPL